MRRIYILCFLLLLVLAGGACAERIPNAEQFSPGFARIREADNRDCTLTESIGLKVENLFLIRDVSMLKEIFQDIRYDVTGIRDHGTEMTTLRITRNADELLNAAFQKQDESFLFQMDEEAWDITALLSECPEMGEAIQTFPMEALLERMPLSWLQDLLSHTGMLLPGIVLEEPMAVETDGHNLLANGRLQIAGEFWQFSADIHHPEGKAPRDSATVNLTRDEENRLTLTYTGAHKDSPGKKGDSGTVTFRRNYRLEGKIQGFRVALNLEMEEKNKWKLSGNELQEKITVTTKLGWQDKTPGRRELLLNSVSADLSHELVITSSETAVSWTDKVGCRVVGDGNTVLKGSADVRATIGEPEPVPVLEADREITEYAELLEILNGKAQQLAGGILPQLSKAAQKKIMKDL